MRAGPGLLVEEQGLDPMHQAARQEGSQILEPGAGDATGELLQIVASPEFVDVGLPQRDGSAQQGPVEEAMIVHLDIPGPLAVDLDVGAGQQPLSQVAKGTRQPRSPCRGEVRWRRWRNSALPALGELSGIVHGEVLPWRRTPFR